MDGQGSADAHFNVVPFRTRIDNPLNRRAFGARLLKPFAVISLYVQSGADYQNERLYRPHRRHSPIENFIEQAPTIGASGGPARALTLGFGAQFASTQSLACRASAAQGFARRRT